LKVALHYCHGSIPISIEVESEALTPESISNILSGILEALEFWLKTLTRKNRDFSPGESSAQRQRGAESWNGKRFASGVGAPSGPEGAVAPNGGSQNEVQRGQL